MFQLNLKHILERAKKYYPNKEIVSKTPEGLIRYTYNELYDRVLRLAYVLSHEFGIKKGDRIASLGWNTHRHLELHFAVPCIGAVLHTVNVRFSPKQIVYCINEAEDRIIFLDPDMAPLIRKLKAELKPIEDYIVMDSGDFPGMYSYEDLLSSYHQGFKLEDINEMQPAVMCYTTGTTGEPKGVVYTHRGIFLRSMATCLADTYRISEKDVVLHVVPMYHISSWFMPYAATLVGSKQVFPGRELNPENLYQLIREESVTVSDGVPTVWINFLDYFMKKGRREDIATLNRLIVGGAAPPLALIKAFDELGVEIIHAWGMTETYDSAVASYIKSYMSNLPKDEIFKLIKKQGLPFPGIEVNIVDDHGNPLPWDGKCIGELIIRGAWVVSEYFKKPKETKDSFIGEWLKTGDMVVIDPEGYIEIVDRVKDLIKSGGEWISSIELENLLMAHPAVLEAAVVGVPHPKWGERPLAIVTLKPGYKASKDDILNFLKGKVPRWWAPDDVVFVKEVPKTSVGKFDKKLIRNLYKNHYTSRNL